MVLNPIIRGLTTGKLPLINPDHAYSNENGAMTHLLLNFLYLISECIPLKGSVVPISVTSVKYLV
jgi:hypothetical protein